MPIGVSAETLRGLIENQQSSGNYGFISPNEDRVHDDLASVWWEQVEIMSVGSKTPKSAEGASWPISTRQELSVEFRVGSESNWYDQNFEVCDPPESANRGKSQKVYNYVQEFGDNEGHNTMTNISLGKLGSIVTAALGVDMENIETLNTTEDGLLDIPSYFQDENSPLLGKWVWAKFRRANESYEKDGKTTVNAKTEFMSALPIEND